MDAAPRPRRTGGEPPDAAPAPGRVTAFVGRAAERSTARGLVDRVAAGYGGALLVVGEAGIGKTRLLDEVAARAAERGLPVLTGRAVPGGGTFRAVAGAVIGLLDDPAHATHPAVAPYRGALGRLLPSWAGPDPPGPGASGTDADPIVVLAEGLLRLLRLTLDRDHGAVAGCVLRLEDLHWADDDTLALVGHLATAVGSDRSGHDASIPRSAQGDRPAPHRAPVLLACSARDDAPAHAARRLTGAPGTVTLRLNRLDEREVAVLAAACRGGRPVSDEEARRLRERSDGLPFAVEELVAAPGTAVPPTLAALVADRLAGLDEPDRAVLHAAAVLGPELDWRLLAPVAGTSEARVLRAVRAAAAQALLVADGAALRWPHALTCDAVLATLLPPERAVLAGRAARVLAARAGPDDEPRAAELFVEAGEPDTAVALLVALSRRDAARGALRRAEQLLAKAAATGAGAASVTTERVALLTLVGRTADALELGAAQLDAPATTTLRGDDHAELCLQLARTAVTAGAWSDVEAHVARAGRPGDPRSLVLRADAAFGSGRVADAVELASAAIARAEQVVDAGGSAVAAAALCEALGVAGRLAWRTDLDVSEALARRAAQVAGEHGLLPWRVVAVFQLGMMRMLRVGDMRAVLEARELALDAGMLGQVAAGDYVRSDYLWMTDGPAAALPTARAAADLARTLHLPQRAFSAAAMAAVLDAFAGVVSGALTGDQARHRAGALAGGTGGGPRLELLLRATTALVEHDLPRAAAELETAAHELRHGVALTPPLPYFGAYVLVAAATGEPERVDARTFVATQVSVNRGAFAWADAVAHGRAGRPREAAALFTEGAAALADTPWWARLLRTVVLECAVVDGWGDPVPALRADLAVHEQEGAVLLARTCRDLLRRAGAPTPRPRGGAAVPPRLRAHGITAREAEVLGLVAQGMTNAQIAARLFLSPRTVDTHVANLLAKTGTPTRTELRAWTEPSP